MSHHLYSSCLLLGDWRSTGSRSVGTIKKWADHKQGLGEKDRLGDSLPSPFLSWQDPARLCSRSSPTHHLDCHHWLRDCNRLHRLVFLIIPLLCNSFGYWMCCLTTLIALTVDLENVIKCRRQGWMLVSPGKSKS